MKLTYRDDSHAYYLDGVRCKSVTTVAKIPDDPYRLNLWSQRQVAIGLAMDADLLHAVAAHVEDDRKLDNLCEKARDKAGANRASQRGTAAHRITDTADSGGTVVPTELAVSVLASWSEVLDAAGLEVVPEYIERIVVYPDRRIAGKFDRILRRKADGRLVIADLKTGDKAIRYPHSIAIQLALYGNAPYLAGPLPADGGTTTDFEPLPDIDRSTAYVIHLPEVGAASAVEMDIAAGWEIVQRAVFPILDWRTKTPADLTKPLGTRYVPPVAAAPKPTAVKPDEGGPVDERDVAALRKAFEAQTPERLAAVVAVTKACAAIGLPTSVSQSPTGRRFEIARGLIAWARFTDGDDPWHELLRTLVRIATGLEVVEQPGVDIGDVVGSMDWQQATRFAQAACLLAEGGALGFDPAGSPVVLPVAA